MATELVKGGEFIIKTSSADEVFTLEDLNEEQRMIRAAVKEFIDREVVPNHDRFEDHDYELTQNLLQKAGELGFLGVTLPEAYNGLEMGFSTSLLVTDYFSGATGSMATAYGAHTGIGTLPIALYGTAQQQEKYLPKLATGQWIGAYCLTEPTAGSDANSGKTTATLSEDKKYYLLNGQKMWISNAGFAHTFIVFARIADDPYLSAFIVEYDKAHPNGIKLGKEEDKLGIHASSTRQVFFQNTKVPVENLLWARNKGFKIAMNILNIGRLKLGAACLDSQRRILGIATTYANEREQFNTKISSFQAIKGKLAQMATNAYVSESAVYRLAKLIEDWTEVYQKEEQLQPQKALLKAVEDFAVECSLVKVFCSEAAQLASDEGIQIYGGMGYSKEAPLEAAWRDARIPRIYEGTNEINRIHAVGMLLKKALKGEIDLLGVARKIQRTLPQPPQPNPAEDSSSFAQEKEVLSNLKKIFIAVAGNAVQQYQTDLEKQQHLVLNMAEILIEIFMVESALLRVEKQAGKKEETRIPMAMVQLKLYQAVEKVAQNAKEAILSFASGEQQRVLLEGLRHWTTYRTYPNSAALKDAIADRVITEGGYCFD